MMSWRPNWWPDNLTWHHDLGWHKGDFALFYLSLLEYDLVRIPAEIFLIHLNILGLVFSWWVEWDEE